MTSIMEVPKADSGVRKRHSHLKVSGARSPRHVTGLWRVESGRKLGQGPLGGITVAEGRDAASWLGITAGRIDTKFCSDTESTGFSNQMDRDDQEEVTTEVYGEDWGHGTLSL